MSKEQALALLDKIIASVPMTRADHAAAIEALKVLAKGDTQ
jgi:hypothetical protein